MNKLEYSALPIAPAIMTLLSRLRRTFPVMILSLVACSGCANGMMSGDSMFANNVPGTSGKNSEEDIIARAAKDPWQPGSQFTVNTAQPGTLR